MREFERRPQAPQTPPGAPEAPPARRTGQARVRYGWLLVALALLVITGGIWRDHALVVVVGVVLAAAAGRLLDPDPRRSPDRGFDS